MNLPDFLIATKFGEVRLRGHRIGLFHLVRHYQDGYSPEMLVCQYPTLPLVLVHKVIAFYLENRAEVDAYVARCEAELNWHRAGNAPRLDIASLRQRFAAQRGVGES